ncbi:MAG TPA: serine hydrolase, partial [Victivallales bacterium]|nr:serine hydrolase [Victivallales bacterium]
MKKVIVTLIIVAIVAGLHYLVIKSFFKPQVQTEKDTPVQNTDSKNGIDKIPQPTSQEPIKEILKQPLKFDYTNAVFGKISELPDSSKPSTGILVDLDTGKVLWAKTPRKPVPIASMTKMMTALLAFEDEKKRDDLDMNTPIQITKTAAKIGGSQLYLDPRETFTFGELLKTVMIMSANDSAQQIAEYLGNGDLYSFVARMNQRAKELNMSLTKFFNPHGLPGKTPSEDNYSTAEAMAILAR